MRGGKKNDKKKKYMNNPQGHSKAFQNLEHSQGFLVTCNESKEKNAVRDVYNILNDYLDLVCEEKGIESHFATDLMPIVTTDLKPTVTTILEKREQPTEEEI